MSLSFRSSEEELAFRKRNRDLTVLRRNWEKLLETILEDSTPEEIQKFASRLEKFPQYTDKEERARQFIRSGANQIRVLDNSTSCRGFYWIDHSEDPVTTIQLPLGLCKKGSKAWIIKI